MSIGNSPEILSQRILAGIILVGSRHNLSRHNLSVGDASLARNEAFPQPSQALRFNRCSHNHCIYRIEPIQALAPVVFPSLRRRENKVGVNMVLAEYHQIQTWLL